MLLYIASKQRYNRTWLWIIILLGGSRPPMPLWVCNFSIFDLTRLNVSTKFWSDFSVEPLMCWLLLLLLSPTDLNPEMLTGSTCSRRVASPAGPAGRRSKRGQSCVHASQSQLKTKPSNKCWALSTEWVTEFLGTFRRKKKSFRTLRQCTGCPPKNVSR